MNQLKILCFLEDLAQEKFIRALVARVADEERVRCTWEVRSARHGSKVITELKKFVKNVRIMYGPLIPGRDAVLVVVDADKDRSKRIKALQRILGDLWDITVPCVPDPHIERFYFLDEKALAEVLGVEVPTLGYHRKKDYYKQHLARLAAQHGSLLGGAEYGDEVARKMDFKLAGKRDSSFRDFLQELRRQLRRCKA